MNLFLAKIVYKIVKPSKDGLEQFDEQLYFIEARDITEAFIKARLMGVKNEDEVDHESGAGIHWKFIDVPYLKQIESFSDGSEIHSTILERDEEDQYERYVKARATDLQSSIERQVLSA